MQLTTARTGHREFTTLGVVVRLEPPGARTVALLPERHVLDISLGGSASEASLDGERIADRACPPSSWRLLSAGGARALHVDRSGRTLRVHFGPDALDGTAAREAVSRAEPDHRFDDELLGITLTLVDHMVRHDIGRHLSASGATMRLADDAVRLMLGRTVQCLERPDEAGRSPVARALRFVGANLDGDLTLASVAAHVGVSQYHFARLFRRDTRTSLKRYVTARRIDWARTLLLSTDAGLADIAYRAGFGSQSHMTTLFGKHLGRTPAQVRRGRVTPSISSNRPASTERRSG